LVTITIPSYSADSTLDSEGSGSSHCMFLWVLDA
jgi:hypothetical protein